MAYLKKEYLSILEKQAETLERHKSVLSETEIEELKEFTVLLEMFKEDNIKHKEAVTEAVKRYRQTDHGKEKRKAWRRKEYVKKKGIQETEKE